MSPHEVYSDYIASPLEILTCFDGADKFAIKHCSVGKTIKRYKETPINTT